MNKNYDTDTVKGRLVEYIRKVEGIGFREFERRMGFSDGTISRPGGLAMTSIIALAENCEELNLRWLLTGNGSMISQEWRSIQNVSGQNAAGTIYGDVTNNTTIEQPTIEKVCDEVKTLKVLVRDLRHDKEILFLSNQKLTDLITSLENQNAHLLARLDKQG